MVLNSAACPLHNTSARSERSLMALLVAVAIRSVAPTKIEPPGAYGLLRTR